MRVIILLTGMPGSGKSVVSEVAKEMGIEVFNMGDVVREEVFRRGLEPTPENILRVATELRERFGQNIIARRVAEKIAKSKSRVVLVDGVRSLYEVEVFRGLGKCIVMAVHASPRTRYERLVRRGRPGDPKNWSEFEKRDRTELAFGIGSVIALADVMIVNEGSLEEFKRTVTKHLEEVLRRIED